MNGWETMGGVIAVVMAVAGLLKYLFYLLDRHKEYTDGRFDQHKDRLDAHGLSIDKNKDAINSTRDELHTDYVRNDNLDKKLNEHRAILDAIFRNLNGMARDLNQLIGAHNGKVKEKDKIGD